MRRTEFTKGDDLRRVRTPEFVKTYHLGRSRSRNGTTMHEAHRVYQIEKSARWNLARGNPPLQPTGPVERLVDGAFKPLPQSAQLEAELHRQKAITKEIEAARHRLTGAIAQMQGKLAEERESTRTIAALQEENAKLEAEIEKLNRAPKISSEKKAEKGGRNRSAETVGRTAVGQ